MACFVAKYSTVRSQMQQGDVIAFAGKGHFSEIIKIVTFSQVSHVATILQTQATYAKGDDDRYFNDIIESTKWKGFMGVGTIRLSDRLRDYDGQVWWLPLSRKLREERSFNVTAFFDFLYAQVGKSYDLPQATASALDALDHILGQYSPTYNREDISRLFCSELVAAGLEAGQMVPSINASEVTPIDLCSWKIYEPNYYQIYWEDEPQGEDRVEIKRFNLYDPALWA